MGTREYLMIFDDGSVGVIKELVDAPEQDEGWDIPRVDFDHLFVGFLSVCQSSVENKQRRVDQLSGPRLVTGHEPDSFVCGTQVDERVDP